VDAIALVSMAGALTLGEYRAGAVVALMPAGGVRAVFRRSRLLSLMYPSRTYGALSVL
jgi:hypothetical protein